MLLLPPPPPGKKVAELVAEFNADRLVAGETGKRRTDSLKQKLEALARQLDLPLVDVRAAHINRALLKTGPSAHTRLNYRGAFSVFIRWAKSHGHLPHGWDFFNEYSVPIPKIKPIEIVLLTPDQLRALLARVDRRLVPFIVLTAFAGVRHGEMVGKKKVLDWKNINLAERVLHVPKTVAKTGRPRSVPIGDALFAWLKPYERPAGPILELASARNFLAAAKRAAAIPADRHQNRNSLRHSYGTYRLPIIKNEPQLALEMGNTVAVIRRNYVDASVTEAAALDWFKTMPPDDEDEKIIQGTLF